MHWALGTEIVEGCYIAYATRYGSCMSAIRLGRVTKVEMKKTHRFDSRETPRISVNVIMQDWYLPIYICKVRKTTLSIPDRAIVLSRDSIPEWCKDILEPSVDKTVAEFKQELSRQQEKNLHFGLLYGKPKV
jgi:hypothetical protein